MKISAGVIIVTDNEILMGNATGTHRYDIPKGGIEEGEKPIDAAVRETEEEFGLKIPKAKLKDLGEFKYLSSKKLHLFLFKVDKMPDVNQLKCTSYFTDRFGRSRPEISGYAVFPIEQIPEVNMAKGLKKILMDMFGLNESILKTVVKETRSL